jgi:hypothetical protein
MMSTDGSYASTIHCLHDDLSILFSTRSYDRCVLAFPIPFPVVTWKLTHNIVEPFPELYWRHDEVNKELTQVWKIFWDEVKVKTQDDYFHSTLVYEIDRQIEQLLGEAKPDIKGKIANESKEDWNRLIPKYVFAKRVQ